MGSFPRSTHGRSAPVRGSKAQDRASRLSGAAHAEAISRSCCRSSLDLAGLMFRFFSVLFALACAASADERDVETQVRRLTDAYALVEHNAADPVASEQAFYQGAIPGMLRRL